MSCMIDAFLLAQTEEGSSQMPCLYLILLVIVVVSLYVAYFLYRHFIGRWQPTPRYCNYCGQVVEPMSDCCQAVVDDQALPPLCAGCGNNCALICSQCKKPI